MQLFNTKGRITPANDKTNLLHRFDMPKGIEEIIIRYSYSPKTVEDREKAVKIVRDCFERYDIEIKGKVGDHLPLNNLVTLSVDANGKYLGAAHRHASEQEHKISKTMSSPGFIKTEIEAGEWDIMLNVHSVSCNIDYTIEVEGVEAK